MKPALFLIGALFLLSSLDQSQDHIKKAEWLTGTWENKSQRGSTYETWTKLTAYELSGKSYMVKGADTVIFETIRLVEERDSLFYIPVVKDQNKGLPVRFALKSATDDALVFENPEHDFPQLISYTRIKNDSLVAEIYGKKNGQERRVRFPMKKVY